MDIPTRMDKLSLREFNETLSKVGARDRIVPEQPQILSRTDRVCGVTIFIITLKGFPLGSTHCLIQRRVVQNSSGSTYPHVVLSKMYLLEVDGERGGEYHLVMDDGENFNAYDWTVKSFIKSDGSASLSTNPTNRVYEYVRDLTHQFISGFKTKKRHSGKQPSRAVKPALDNLRLTLQPLSCRKVKFIWSCASCLEHTASTIPQSSCMLRPESGDKGRANGLIVHVMEHWMNGPGKEWLMTLELGGCRVEEGCCELELPVDLVPGHWFTIRTSSVNMSVTHSKQTYTIIHPKGFNIVTYRAEHTVHELHWLLEKARLIRNPSAVRAEFLPCQWLYRHKPPEYYHNIFTYFGGLMHPYIKDYNGDPASCINGKLNGLFFSADVNFRTLQPCEFPVFGKARISLPSSSILRNSRLYFADVYCLRPSIHYVTLVLTTPGTPADLFCAQRLVELDMNDWGSNPYLFKYQGMPYVTTRLHVEILVTDSVDIGSYLTTGLGILEIIQRGSALDHMRRHGGRPKRTECQLCNL